MDVCEQVADDFLAVCAGELGSAGEVKVVLQGTGVVLDDRDEI